MTQIQLARRAEANLPDGRTMSPQRYWQIENGFGAPPDNDEKAAVAAAVGVTVAEVAWPNVVRAKAS